MQSARRMPGKSESGNSNWEISPQSLPGTNFSFLLFPDCVRGREGGSERPPLTSSWKGRNYAAHTAAAAALLFMGRNAIASTDPQCGPCPPVNTYPAGEQILFPFDLRLTRRLANVNLRDMTNSNKILKNRAGTINHDDKHASAASCNGVECYLCHAPQMRIRSRARKPLRRPARLILTRPSTWHAL